jgi:hypothetical protein
MSNVKVQGVQTIELHLPVQPKSLSWWVDSGGARIWNLGIYSYFHIIKKKSESIGLKYNLE